MHDSLGDRQKDYEKRNRRYLTRKVPVLMRLDGKAFHTFTRGCDKPFDRRIINAMQNTTRYLIEGIQGAKVGYVQSDEITLLLTDFDNIETEAWFDYCQNKIESVSAAMAAVKFTLEYNFAGLTELHPPVTDIKTAEFDCRAWNHPKEDVMNNFRWRYQDWLRNSIQMLARSLYSHKELHGKKTPELHDMCFAKGHNWNDLPGECKNGTLFVRGEEGAVKLTDFNLNSNEFCDRLFNQFLYPMKE